MPHRNPCPPGIATILGLMLASAGLPALLAQQDPIAAVGEVRAATPTVIDPPALPGAGFPALAAERPTTVSHEEEILMTWLDPGEGGGRLRFARRSGGEWSLPITVADGVSVLSAADRASLTVIDTQGVRRTLIARTGDAVARSGDGGRTWSRLPSPALPFASFAGGDEGAYAFWLRPGEGGMARLLGTRVLAGETLLDAEALDGSGTTSAMTWDGPVVVYRDSLDGATGIAIVRRHNARWSEPRSVYVDGALPSSGLRGSPSVAALRRDVAVAWHAENREGGRVLAAFSSDAGRTFGSAIEVAAQGPDSAPSGLVDVALDDEGRALVLWTAVVSDGTASLFLARASQDGTLGEPLVLADDLPPGPEAAPRIARIGRRVGVVWIVGVPRQVRAVEVPLSAIPTALRTQAPKTSTAPAAPRRLAGRGRVGESLPEVEVHSLEGLPISFDSLAGSVVLLNLWATWCLPCIAEMPALAALHEEDGPRGLVVVGLNVDSAEALPKVRAFMAEHEIPFDVWLDPEMGLYEALRVRSLPSTILIDRRGKIVWRRDQAIEADDSGLRRALDRALG